MQEPLAAQAATRVQPEFDDALPPGNHALEVAARSGFGPLSNLAHEAWHGRAVPCVSCGQLVRRDESACVHCEQDLSDEMIKKMRQHAGPWFVLEHVRPFPGVSLERIVRQIRRGLITETSIVRGPSSDYQWRFAVETPGLCRYFGRCWCCHAPVTLSDTYCPQCLHYLSFEKPRTGAQVPAAEVHTAESPAPPAAGGVTREPARAGVAASTSAIPSQAASSARAAAITSVPPASQVQSQPVRAAGGMVMPQPVAATAPTQSSDLARLSAAVRQARVSHMDSEWDQPPRVGGVNVTWIAALLIIAAVVALLLISRARSDRPALQTSPALPTMTDIPKAAEPAAGTTTAPAPAGNVPRKIESPPPDAPPVQGTAPTTSSQDAQPTEPAPQPSQAP